MPTPRFRALLLCALAVCGAVSPAQQTPREPSKLSTASTSFIFCCTPSARRSTPSTCFPTVGRCCARPSTTNDRGARRTTSTILDFGPQATPLRLEQQTSTAASTPTPDTTQIAGSTATITEAGLTRTTAKPPVAFVGFANMPAALQMLMMRYWLAPPPTRAPAHPARQPGGSAARDQARRPRGLPGQGPHGPAQPLHSHQPASSAAKFYG